MVYCPHAGNKESDCDDDEQGNVRPKFQDGGDRKDRVQRETAAEVSASSHLPGAVAAADAVLRMAAKYHAKRIRQAMEEQYKEMGMTSIVFACYPRPDGKLAIDV